MAKFITHDTIAQGIFNHDTCAAVGAMTAWRAELLNTPDILELLVKRLEHDYENLHVKMRKAYTFKDVEPCCH